LTSIRFLDQRMMPPSGSSLYMQALNVEESKKRSWELGVILSAWVIHFSATCVSLA
jgi:hypothetical protein